MYFYWAQFDDLKYNSYIGSKHPDWELLDVVPKMDEDPLGIRYYFNEMLAVQFIIYIGVSIVKLLQRFRSLNQQLFNTKNELLITLRNTVIHFIIIISVFLVTKLYFGMRSDIGGYWIASYISFMIYVTSYQVLNRSEFFNHPSSFMAFPMPKYQKSSLSEDNKELILSKIKKEMENQTIFPII